MADFKNNGEDHDDRERALQQENTELREKLREAEAERDQYLKMVHTWARHAISEEELKRWEKDEDRGDGRTPMDILAEVQREAS